MKPIPLTQGKFALVDDKDYEFLNQWKWCCHKEKTNGEYATRNEYTFDNKGNKKGKTIYMHRQILDFPEYKIDHKDGNGLNNQRDNLRKATNSQNSVNSHKQKNTTSKYKGVCWCKRKEKWIAKIWINYKTINLGYFDKENDAALAYNIKAIELFGEFAKLNIIS